MGIHQQYHSKRHHLRSSSARLLRLTSPSTSSFLCDSKSDFIWNNPDELDLLDMKKAPMISTMIDENHFFKVLPCIRRLYAAFNSRCPNVYRIHCPDSFRVLQELVCLIEHYLRIRPSPTIPIDVLLDEEDRMDEFIDTIKYSQCYPFYSGPYTSTDKIDIRCFGQGIRSRDCDNELQQTLLFCFEVATSIPTTLLLPIDVLIWDPNECIVSHDTRYINTYDQGQTKLFSCSYQPKTYEGTYKISFVYDNVQLTKCPYTVYIRHPASTKQSEPFVDEDPAPIHEQSKNHH